MNSYKLEEIKALSDDELRIKVAELLGWTNLCRMPTGPCPALVPHDQQPLFGCRIGCVDSEIVRRYPHDLNACHEMEKTLSETDKWLYYDALCVVVGAHQTKMHVTKDLWLVVSATARQRCEAFVLTMEEANKGS